MEIEHKLEVHEQIEGEIDISDKSSEDVISTTENDIKEKTNILQQSEEFILGSLKIPYKGQYVNIGPVIEGEKDCQIWTVSLNEHSQEIPVVLIHGFGAGVGFWALNLKELSETRPVYAIDLLGFARSSRPKFSSIPENAENELVDSIEAWRVAMNLKKIAIVGHSFGGYLSTCYSIRYPEPVAHLILADPWGFKEKPAVVRPLIKLPFHKRMLVRIVAPLNPLPFSALRLAGSCIGPKLIQQNRGDIIAKFEPVVEDAYTHIAKYIYHCNAEKPTGEIAFHSLQSQFGWAKSPLNRRLDLLDEKIPMTLIYGSSSWVDHLPSVSFQEKRPTSYLDAHIIDGAGHHVYADNVEEFNRIISQACQNIKLNL